MDQSITRYTKNQSRPADLKTWLSISAVLLLALGYLTQPTRSYNNPAGEHWGKTAPQNPGVAQHSFNAQGDPSPRPKTKIATTIDSSLWGHKERTQGQPVHLSIATGGISQVQVHVKYPTINYRPSLEGLPVLASGMTNVTDEPQGYHIGANGSLAIKVAIGYDLAKVPPGYQINDIFSYRYDPKIKKWTQLKREGIDFGQQEVHSVGEGEGTYINAIIKAPEAAQTQGYVPTAMNDIKTADPSAMLQVIQAPQANHQGTANLRYHLQSEQGRLGIEPDLNINYNSDSGPGILGEGWNLSGVSVITVDTRWGVPRYLNTTESETYQLDGKMLAMADQGTDSVPITAHRKQGIARLADREFAQRKEDKFDKIVRKGDKPDNYYWTVTDKSTLNVYYYGAHKDINGNVSLDEHSVLRNPASHEIAEWRLSRMEDPFGNYVEYSYRNIGQLIGGNTVTGLYLTNIAYTRHRKSSWYYYINLNYQNNLSEGSINFGARYGFLTSNNNQLLSSVDMNLVEENSGGQSFANIHPIRKYKFGYHIGDFGKVLLDSIGQYGYHGKTEVLFPGAGHHFEYFGFSALTEQFEVAKTIAIPSQAPLGSSATLPKISFGATAGAGYMDGNLASKSMTVDGQFSYRQNESSGLSAFVDIDGNGLPDIVTKSGNTLSYLPNLTKEGIPKFGAKQSITGISAFSRDAGNSIGKGWQANGPSGTSSFIGQDNSRSENANNIYFADANGDGLLDVVDNGRVYFNLAQETGKAITFSPISTRTFNPIVKAGGIDAKFKLDAVEMNRQKAENIATSPLIDVVKIWIATDSGKIEIQAPVRLLKPTFRTGNYEDSLRLGKRDGVVVSAQINNTPLWPQLPIGKDDFSEKLTAKLVRVVNKGDKITFRVQSGNTAEANGDFDEVSWDPKIVYLSKKTDKDVIDVFGDNGFEFSSKKDFLQSNGVLDLPETGSYSIIGHFKKQKTADSVYILVKKYTKTIFGNLPDTSILVKRGSTFGADTTITIKDRHTYTIKEDILERTGFDQQASSKAVIFPFTTYPKDTKLTFEVRGASNVNLKAIDWSPQIFINHADPKHPGSGPLKDTVYIYPNYSFKGQLITGAKIIKVRDSGRVSLLPVVNFPAEKKSSVAFIVSDKSGVLRKKYLSGQVKPTDSIELNRNRNEAFFVSYEVASIEGIDTTGTSPYVVATLPDFKHWKVPYTGKFTFFGVDTGYLKRSKYKINNGPLSKPIGKDTLKNLSLKDGDEFVIIDTADNKPVSFSVAMKQSSMLSTIWDEANYGKLYRGWGQFAYNGMDQLTTVIPVAKMQASGQQETNIAKVGFFAMVHNQDSAFYQGPGLRQFIRFDTIGVSRLAMADVQPLDIFDLKTTVNGAGAFAVVKGSRSFSRSTSGGVLISKSWAAGHSETLSDYTDMNGDRYPDILNQSAVQYTNPTGGLSGANIPFNSGTGLQRSEINAHGTNLGGLFSHAFSTAARSKSAESDKTSSGNSSVAQTLIGLFPLSGAGNNDNNDQVVTSIYDLNGDGLPDKVEGNRVYLNLGYSYSPNSMPFIFSGIRVNYSQTQSLGGGISSDNNSFSAGYNLSSTQTTQSIAMMDVNGDGLTDEVRKVATGISVRFNTGNGLSAAYTLNGIGNPSMSKSDDKGIGGSYTVGFSPFLIPIKIVFSASANTSIGASTTLQQFIDFNGDGFPDFLEYDGKDNLRIRSSQLGKINKLSGIARPLGGQVAIDYKQSEATFAHPGGKWVLASVLTKDGLGFDGLDAKTTYDYQDGQYDRYEREFLGFGQVSENQFNQGVVYRKNIRRFANDNYYTADKMTRQWVEDATGGKFNEVEWQYRLYIREKVGTHQRRTINTLDGFYNGIVQSPLHVTINKAYEGAKTNPLILNETLLEDDEFGNITAYRYSDKGRLISSGEFDYKVTTKFKKPDMKNYVTGLSESFEVRDSQGNLLRKQTADYYPWQETAPDGTVKAFRNKLKSQTVQLNSTEKAITSFDYDVQFGSLAKKTFPNGFFITYAHEDKLNTYLQTITDAYALKTVNVYSIESLKFGLPEKTILSNLHPIKYKYDDFGRTDTIVGVNETVAEKNKNYTLAFAYHPEAKTAYALTKHYDYSHESADGGIYTINFVDGDGKTLQVKKTAVVAGVNKWAVNAMQQYDQLGRAVETYYPVLQDYEIQKGSPAGAALLPYLSHDTETKPMKTAYDVLDRIIQIALPDQSSGNKVYSTTRYQIGTDAFNNKVRLAITTFSSDGLSNRKDVYTNGSDLTSTTSNYRDKAATDAIVTKYRYTALNQLKAVLDRNNVPMMAHEYDMSGRAIEQRNDSGAPVKYTYDLAGNIILKENGRGEEIEYKYKFNRLIAIKYPKHPGDSVRYTYGNREATGQNGLGRVVLMEDATGAQSYSYDEMGNIVKNIRTIIAPFDSTYTFTTAYKYDSWGRLREMTYPGGEDVVYTYNLAGQLEAVLGYKKGSDRKNSDYPYVRGIRYDKFEQRSAITYGNDITTSYSYEVDRRRLQEVKSIQGKTKLLMQSKYEYDELNNLKLNANTAPVNNGIMGVNMQHKYDYNNLNQLKYAKGDWDTAVSYELNLDFNDSYNVKKRELTLSSAPIKRTVKSAYDYDPSHPTMISRIKENITHNNRKEVRADYYHYDLDGNNDMNSIADSFQRNVNERKIHWDEQNRIRAVSINGQVSSYTYDANAERTIKISTQELNVYVNGKLAGDTVTTNSFSLIVNPYYSMRNGNLIGTKHIYIGKERIVSQLTDVAQWTNNDNDETMDPRRKTLEFPAVQSNQNYLVPFSKKMASEEQAINGFYDHFDLPHQLIKHGDFKKQPRLVYNLASNPNSPNDIGLVENTVSKEESSRFFYHNNYLGSTSFITDKDAKVVQYAEYLPFGETFMEQREHYSGQFLFNGKEQDEETGLFYYGARYYDPHSYQWLGVDPMQDKYPGLSPYNFNLGNPIIYRDENGKTPKLYIETEGFGHAFVTTGSDKSPTVYTFGRYLGGDYPFLGSASPTGAGVLIKLEGKVAKAYINDKINDSGAKSYDITDASDLKINEHFSQIWSKATALNSEQGQAYSQRNKYGGVKDARIVESYNLFNNNCVTKSINMLKAGGSKLDFSQNYKNLVDDFGRPIINDAKIYIPADLKLYMESQKQ